MPWDVEAVEIGTPLGELMNVFERSGHSRMPVYFETLDDPRGMVHIRDVLAHITRVARARKGRTGRKAAAAATLDLANVDLGKTIGELDLIRTVLFVPPSMLASDLMARMQATRTQMALVIDEYGGTDGLVSLEDIVEKVVGDIEDEHDDDEPMITQASDGIFIADGKAEIDDVAKMVGENFAAGEHGEYVDTIGGMIFNTLGRVPARLLPTGKEKIRVSLEALGAEPAAPFIERAGVCVVERPAGAQVAFEPLAASSLEAALCGRSEPGFDLFDGQRSELARALAVGGGWRLTLSSRPEEAIPALHRLLDQVDARLDRTSAS